MLKDLVPAVQKKLGCQLDHKRYLLVGNAFNKFSVFLYKQDDQRPVCIAKVACNDAALQKCNNEYSILRFLIDSPITSIRAAEPLGTLQTADRLVFLQDYVESRLLIGDLPLFGRAFRQRHFAIAVDRLSDIYRSTREPHSIAGRSYSRCFQHGDFWLGNLGILPGQLALYDLEFSQVLGTPLYDLLHFGIYYYRVLSNIGTYHVIRPATGPSNQPTDRRTLTLQSNDIRAVFGSQNRYSKVMYAAIFAYILNCQIDHKDALDLLLKFIGQDRRVDGLSENWEFSIESTYEIWRKKWSGT